MKWLLRILYGFLVVIAGLFVMSEADAAKRMKYLEDNAQEYYDNDDIGSYMENFFIAAGRTKYIEEPIYSAVSNDDKYKFKFSVYETRVEGKDDNVDVVVFALSNLDLDVTPVDQESFDKNNNLIKVRVNIEFANYPTAVDYSLEGKSIPFNLNDSIDVFIPFEVVLGENEDGEKMFSLRDKLTDEIEAITLDIVDLTAATSEVEPTITTFARFSNSNHAEKTGVSEVLTKRTVTLGTGDEAREVELMDADLFNGSAERFDLESVYETNDESVVATPDLDLLKPYNSTVVKYASIYIGVVILITYLLFLLKPTIQYFKGKRSQKAIESRPEISEEQIFKDE